MNDLKKLKNKIDNFIEVNKHLLSDLRIILLANVVGKTMHKAGKGISNIDIEFFSEQEINELLIGLRENDLYVEVYFDESKFMQDVIDKTIENVDKILVFNLARNGFGVGKKSLIPAFCDFMQIKHTGSNAYAVSFARNKFHYSKLLSQMNLNGTPSWLYINDNWLLNDSPPSNMMVILKPLFECASKGIDNDSIMNSSDTNFIFILQKKANQLQQPIIVQKFISGYEVEVPIIALSSPLIFSPLGVKMNNSEFLGNTIIKEEDSISYLYDYYIVKNILGEQKNTELVNAAKNIFYALGLENYARVDFRIDKEGKFYVTDISTTPYIILHSSFCYIFEQLGYKHKDLLLTIVLSALLAKLKD